MLHAVRQRLLSFIRLGGLFMGRLLSIDLTSLRNCRVYLVVAVVFEVLWMCIREDLYIVKSLSS